MKAYLRVVKGAGPATEFPVEGSIEIGRAARGWGLVLRREGEEISLGVEDAMASRRHALLYLESGRLMVRDMGSVNGTMVNNRLLPQWVTRKGSAPRRLRDGAIIKIGSSEMEIRIDTTPSYDELVKLFREVKLESELSRRHPAEDARRLANSFRIILEINDQCCNTDTRVKELNSRLDMLKEYLADDAMVAEVDNLQRRISTELYEEEFLHERQVWEVKNFCHRFAEQWSSRFMK